VKGPGSRTSIMIIISSRAHQQQQQQHISSRPSAHAVRRQAITAPKKICTREACQTASTIILITTQSFPTSAA
jgi:hypothetical protein